MFHYFFVGLSLKNYKINFFIIDRLAENMKKVILAVSLALASMAANAAVVTFDGNAMNLVGAANVVGGDIQLVSIGASAGAVWLTSGVSTANSFNVNFTFSLQAGNTFPMADGITFAMQNQGVNALGTSGGFLGYGGLGAVGFVVQTYTNNTAGLNIDGNPYNTMSAASNLGGAGLVTGTEQLTYDATTHMLSLTGALVVDGVTDTLSEVMAIDLAAQFGSTMYMGFTGASGANYADERVTSFSVSSTPGASVPEPVSSSLLLAGLGLMGFMSRRRNNS